jgi:hypothetical protein
LYEDFSPSFFARFLLLYGELEKFFDFSSIGCRASDTAQLLFSELLESTVQPLVAADWDTCPVVLMLKLNKAMDSRAEIRADV